VIHVVDAMGFDVRLATPARRIVSLVPSETELVAQLGAGDRLVGRTEYCIAPAEVVANVPAVGGTKNASVDAIVDLRPDLVLANQEENTEAMVVALRERGACVHVSFPKTVTDALALAETVARLVGIDPAAVGPIASARASIALAETARASSRPVRVFCPIWMDPLMTLHGDTFMSDVLDLAGAVNVFADRPRRYPLAADLGRADPWPASRVAGRDTRYPRVTLDEVVARAPEVIVLPDEPHAFTDADAAVFRALDTPASRDGRIVFIDGKDVCWYSLRVASGIARIRGAIGPARGAVLSPTRSAI